MSFGNLLVLIGSGFLMFGNGGGEVVQEIDVIDNENLFVSENQIEFEGKTYSLPNEDVFTFNHDKSKADFGPLSVVPESPYEDDKRHVFSMEKVEYRSMEDVIRDLEINGGLNIEEYAASKVVGWEMSGMCTYQNFEMIGSKSNVLITGMDCSGNDMRAYIEEFLEL